MSPPQLTGYAPIPYVFHPVEINFFKARGHKIDLAVSSRTSIARSASGFIFTNHCLLHDRLHRGSAAVALPDVVGIILYLDKLPQLVHFGNQPFCALPRGSAPQTYCPLFRSSLPSSFMTRKISRLCLKPTSKSLGSCAGVILTTPVPKSFST